MKEGAVDSGVERHSVWTPGWNSPSCSSLGMTGNMKAMLNRMPRSYFCRFSRVLRQRMSNQLIRSPVFVVWSLGGMVPWLAFCLCHFSCWPLVPFQWHWSHSNVQGPERAAVMQSCNVELTRSAQELHPLRSRHRYTLTTKLTWRQDSQHAVPQSMKKNLSQNALPPPQAWIARRLVLKQDAVWLCMNTVEELASLQCMSIHPSIHPSVRLLAHHSPLRPPPEDSQQHNHTVPLPEHTHFLLSANRKTHYPATKQMGNNRWSFYFKSWTFFFCLMLSWSTWHGWPGPVVVAGAFEVVAGLDVGEVSGRLLFSGSNTHSLEKEMSSTATSPLCPWPLWYLKTI